MHGKVLTNSTPPAWWQLYKLKNEWKWIAFAKNTFIEMKVNKHFVTFIHYNNN